MGDLCVTKSKNSRSRKPRKVSNRRAPRSARRADGSLTVGAQSATSGKGLIMQPTISVRGVRMENKYTPYVLTTNFASVSTSGKSYDFGGSVAEGTDYLNRIGREIRLTGLRIFGQLVGGQSNSATDENRNVVRISVVEISPGASLANYSVTSVADPRNWGCRRVLFDKLYSLNTPGRDSTGYLPACVMVDEHVPLNDRIYYSGTAANTQIGLSYALWMVSDSGAVPNPGFTNGTLSIGFIDQ